MAKGTHLIDPDDSTQTACGLPAFGRKIGVTGVRCQGCRKRLYEIRERIPEVDRTLRLEELTEEVFDLKRKLNEAKRLAKANQKKADAHDALREELTRLRRATARLHAKAEWHDLARCLIETGRFDSMQQVYSWAAGLLGWSVEDLHAGNLDMTQLSHLNKMALILLTTKLEKRQDD